MVEAEAIDSEKLSHEKSIFFSFEKDRFSRILKKTGKNNLICPMKSVDILKRAQSPCQETLRKDLGPRPNYRNAVTA